MSKQALDAFKGKLAEDRALRDEMARDLSAGGSKTTASVQDLVAFAKTRGYEFSPDEVRQNIELSDEQLDAVAGGAQVDYFLKLEGVDGEARQDGHKDQIELMSYSWGVQKK